MARTGAEQSGPRDEDAVQIRVPPGRPVQPSSGAKLPTKVSSLRIGFLQIKCISIHSCVCSFGYFAGKCVCSQIHVFCGNISGSAVPVL